MSVNHLSTRRGERGDTIAEVLIVLVIVSSMMVTAYGVTNRNTISNQTAQEQTVAQKLVQQQIELLRNNDSLSAQGSSTCLDNGGAWTSGAACKLSPTPGGAVYDMSITLDTSRGYPTYVVSANWTTLAGHTATVTDYYRTK